MWEQIQKIKENIRQVLVGKESVTDLVLASLLARGHVLLEDLPGTGKTVLARTLAASLSCGFGRIQFTPDLLPGDVTGLNYFDQEKGHFVFREGPVFTQILLADEINRATPRTQSALLECMAENQVTVDGETRRMAEPFFVIATQNPVETYGCFPLPEAQLDRFLMKLSMGDLSAEEERKMVDRFMTDDPLTTLSSVASAEEIQMLQTECRKIFVHEDLRDYIVSLSRKSREGNDNLGGISPRGTLSLVRASQGFAMVRGREYVVPEDIKEVAVPVLSHRLISAETDDAGRKRKIRALLDSVRVPTENWGKA